MGNSAYFVRRPRIGDDLREPHLPEEEREYEIVKLITLYQIDYENFYYDMLADRQFIEDWRHLCAEEPVFRCIAVQSRRSDGCILVVPERECFVKWAAFVPRIQGRK